MPLTFIDIEKQKNWRIGIFFIVLLFLYFIITAIFVEAIFWIFPVHTLKSGLTPFVGDMKSLLVIFVFSVIFASIHFYFSAFGAVKSVMENLRAMPPDPEDSIHKRYTNIIEEINVASGDKRRIKGMVIPSLSMNAVAAADLKGDAAIAITEGLLSRLRREQLEAVLAHEAYHILSRDCVEATVATSLFGMYASALEKFRDLAEEDPMPIQFLSPPFLLFWILLKLSQLLNMFISREREYRADAGSVRITRNPIALAEALHLLSRNWNGIGFLGRGIEMLCLVNPQEASEDESEGWWSNLKSTHPPIKKRIEILLKMAHVSISELEEKAGLERKRIDVSQTAVPFYYALDPRHQWQGPFNLEELAVLPWLSPLTWVSKGSKESIERAWRNTSLNTIFEDRLSQEETTDFTCPNCQQSLVKKSYESTQIFQCNFCGGTLVEDDKIPRIIARRERPCTERVNSLAKAVINENQKALTRRILKGAEKRRIDLIDCPKCKNPMLRTFYSLAYLIEIDRCSYCGLTWFDADELEMLQCLIENRITASFRL